MTATKAIEDLTSDEQATFRSEIGAASSAALSTETANRVAGDAALQTAIGNLSSTSGVPMSWAPTNPASNNDPNYRVGVQWSITVDGSLMNPGFPSYAGHSVYMVVQNGENDPDQVSKTTFITQGVSMVAYGAGQRVMMANRLTGFGNGDCIVEDKLMEVYGGVSADGDEGQKVDRYYMAQGGYIQTATISTVVRSSVDTVTSQSIDASKDAQTVAVANATGVSVGDWIQFDVSAPGGGGVFNQTPFTRAEAVKVLAVNGNSITGIFRHSHPVGAIVKGCVVLGFNGGTSFGQQRSLVNLSLPTYTTGQARGNGDNNASSALTGSGTSWSNTMVGGNQYCIGLFSFDVDETANYNSGLPLRVYYPIWNVSSTSLNIFRKNQVGGPNIYQGKARTLGNSTFYNYKIFAGAKILETDGNTAIVILEHNTFNWQPGHTVECAHSQSIDCSLATWRVVMHSPGMDYRTGLELSNHGSQDFACGIYVDGGQFGGEWANGVSSRGRDNCYYANLSSDQTNAIKISHSDTQRAAIDWTNRMRIEFRPTVGNSYGGMRIKTTSYGYDGLLDFYGSQPNGSNVWDTLQRAEYNGDLILKTAVNLTPKFEIQTHRGDTISMEPYFNSGTQMSGLKIYRNYNGTKTLLGTIG